MFFPMFIFLMTVAYIAIGAFQLFVRNELGVAVAMFCAAAAILYVGVDAQ